MTTFAGRPEEKWLPDSSDVGRTADQTSGIKEDVDDGIVNYEREKILETLCDDDAVICFSNTLNNRSSTINDSDKLSEIENLFGCKLEITTAYHILDTATENKYTRFVSEDKTEVSFSEDGSLFKVSTIYGDVLTKQNRKTSIKEMQNMCLDLMPNLY